MRSRKARIPAMVTGITSGILLWLFLVRDNEILGTVIGIAFPLWLLFELWSWRRRRQLDNGQAMQ